MDRNILQAAGVDKHFGGAAALRQASFALRPGEVHALMGENGAGKSTLAKILAGAIRADRAAITVDGRAVTIASPLDAQRLGIGIIFQELDLFRDLTVGENMVIGNLRFREGRVVRPARIESFCRPFLDQVGLGCGIGRMAGELSIGERQLLAIARVLSMDARVILMDEPTSSLFHDAVERLFELIRRLKLRGVSTVYVSHKMDEIFRICDRATVLRDGQTVGTLDVAATTADEIIRLMVGRDVGMADRAERPPAGDVILRVDGLTTAKLRNVSFQLRRGEVLGVAGLVGAGRSELGAALFGLDPIRGGTIHRAGRCSIGLVPEDRRLEGLMMDMSVLENGTFAVLRQMQRLGVVQRARERASMESVGRRTALHAASLDAAVSSLSGGNQQKVLLARWLLANPDVLFLDDPTRGIDVAAKQDIYRVIEELAAAGKGVILVSSELPELLRCSDRILVLNGGAATAEFDRAAATPEKIMAAATGGAA